MIREESLNEFIEEEAFPLFEGLLQDEIGDVRSATLSSLLPLIESLPPTSPLPDLLLPLSLSLAMTDDQTSTDMKMMAVFYMEDI